MTALEVPGDAAVLAREGAALDAAASALLELTAALHCLADDDESIGRAADALRVRTTEAAASVLRVEPRYRATAEVLTGFSVVLDDVQQRVRGAAARAEEAAEEAAGFDGRLDELARLRPIGVEEAAELLEWEERRDALERLRGAALERLIDAERAADDAWDDWREAGDRAAERVGDEFERLADSMLEAVVDAVVSAAEAVVDAVERLDDWAAIVGEWITTVLDDALTLLIVVGAGLAAAAVLLAFLVIAFTNPLVMLGLSSGALDIGAVIDAGIATTLRVLPALAPGLALLLAREALRPTPEMRRDGALERAHVVRGREGLAEYALEQNGAIDALGGADRTVVQIVEVLDADGERVAWRVTLPSTQDWQLSGDAGAMNDLGSNLALMLAPGMQAAYERAVLDAMADAGIRPDDPVMLVGFSQGGILAGKLAADPELPYDVDAVLAAGAPIDHFPIARSGPDAPIVLSLQHAGPDAVPLLDGTAPEQSERWRTVAVDPGEGEALHGANSYAITAARHLDGENGDELGSADVARFFSENERAQYYVGAER